METMRKRRREVTVTVNDFESVRKLFSKTVDALYASQSVNFRKEDSRLKAAKWVINAMVLTVAYHQYEAAFHPDATSSRKSNYIVTFCDTLLEPVPSLSRAASQLSKLADKEATQDTPFQWTPAQKQLSLYPKLEEECALYTYQFADGGEPKVAGPVPSVPRQQQKESLPSCAADKAHSRSTSPTGTDTTALEQLPSSEHAVLQTLVRKKARVVGLQKDLNKLQAPLVVAQQMREAGPNQKRSEMSLLALLAEADKAEAIWKQKQQEAADAESAWRALTDTDSALYLRIAVGNTSVAMEEAERELAAAREDVLKCY